MLARVQLEQVGMLMPIISQAGDILIDWRSSIGSTAMNLVTSFFKERDYDSEDIKEYVEWALTGFNFLYADPEGPVVSGSATNIRPYF